MECAPLPPVTHTMSPLPCAMVMTQKEVDQISVIEERENEWKAYYYIHPVCIHRVEKDRLEVAVCNQQFIANILEAPKVLGYWNTHSGGCVVSENLGTDTFLTHFQDAARRDDYDRIRELIKLGVSKIIHINTMGIAHNGMSNLENIVMPYVNSTRFIHFEYSAKFSGLIVRDVYDFMGAVFLAANNVGYSRLDHVLMRYPFYDFAYVSSLFDHIPEADSLGYTVTERIISKFT